VANAGQRGGEREGGRGRGRREIKEIGREHLSCCVRLVLCDAYGL